MTAWWLDGAKLDLSDICEEISAVIYDKSSVHCINIPLETMGSRGEETSFPPKKWQVGSLRTWSFKVLSILRDGILMEVSKSLVEKGLKLNKQKKMCPANLLFISRKEQRMFCTHPIRHQSSLSHPELWYFLKFNICLWLRPYLVERTPLKVKPFCSEKGNLC